MQALRGGVMPLQVRVRVRSKFSVNLALSDTVIGRVIVCGSLEPD